MTWTIIVSNDNNISNTSNIYIYIYIYIYLVGDALCSNEWCLSRYYGVTFWLYTRVIEKEPDGTAARRACC